VLNKETPEYVRLLKSAHKHGIPLKSYFFDEQDYDKFIARKHLFIKEALEELWATSGCNRFMFVDAFDTCFVSAPKLNILTDNYLTFGGEKNCYPEPAYASAYPQDGEFPYLNSGVIWGPISLYKLYCPGDYGHDQLLWTRQFFNHPAASMQIDTHASVALNLHSTKAENLSRYADRVEYAGENGTAYPMVLHANGKWPMPAWAGL
jgi:hypothetical protein